MLDEEESKGQPPLLMDERAIRKREKRKLRRKKLKQKEQEDTDLDFITENL